MSPTTTSSTPDTAVYTYTHRVAGQRRDWYAVTLDGVTQNYADAGGLILDADGEVAPETEHLARVRAAIDAAPPLPPDSADRTRAMYRRRRAAGLVRVHAWIPDTLEARAALAACVRGLRG